MGDVASKGSFNEELAIFFEGKMCEEADFAYRAAYAWTLSRQAAFTCVQWAYKELVSGLEELSKLDTFPLRQRIMKTLWQSFHKFQKTHKVDPGKAPLVQFFSSMSLEARSALVLVDVCGLTPHGAAVVMGLDEVQLRRELAQGRKSLMNFSGMD